MCDSSFFVLSQCIPVVFTVALLSAVVVLTALISMKMMSDIALLNAVFDVSVSFI